MQGAGWTVARGTMTGPWWQDEPIVTNRRQSLPHTDAKLPTGSDVWKIFKALVSSQCSITSCCSSMLGLASMG